MHTSNYLLHQLHPLLALETHENQNWRKSRKVKCYKMLVTQRQQTEKIVKYVHWICCTLLVPRNKYIYNKCPMSFSEYKYFFFTLKLTGINMRFAPSYLT